MGSTIRLDNLPAFAVRTIIGGILGQDLDVPMPQATDAEFIEMMFHQLNAA